MNAVTGTPHSKPLEESPVQRTLSNKERLIKLIHAIALTIFSLGIALFFPSVQQMFHDFWTGKTITMITEDTSSAPTLQSPEQPAKPQKLTIGVTFEELQAATGEIDYELTTNVRPRFSNIPCPKETVVKVGDRSIHANWVKMPDGRTYIASQAPITVDFGVFWKAAFENNGFIVDITTLRDGISPYFPLGGREFYETGSVEYVNSQEMGEHLTLFTYKVQIDGNTKQVQRLHFSGWKDFDVTDMGQLIEITKIIDKKMGVGKVPIVHCRAGVGRTGTLISTLALRNMEKQGLLSQGNINETFKDVVMTGRRCRGPGFIQTEEQLEVVKAALTV